MSPRARKGDTAESVTFSAVDGLPIRKKYTKPRQQSPTRERKVWHAVTVQFDATDPTQCCVLSQHPNWHIRVRTPQRLVPDNHLASVLRELSTKDDYKHIKIDPRNPKKRKDDDPIRTKDYYSKLYVDERPRLIDDRPFDPNAPRAVDIAPVDIRWRFFSHHRVPDLAREMKISRREKAQELRDLPDSYNNYRMVRDSFRRLQNQVRSGSAPKITNIIAFGMQSLHQYRLDTEAVKADNQGSRSILLDILQAREDMGNPPTIVQGAHLSRTDKAYFKTEGLIPIDDPEVFNYVNQGTLVINYSMYAEMDYTCATNVYPAAYMTVDYNLFDEEYFNAWDFDAVRFLEKYTSSPLTRPVESSWWRIYQRKPSTKAERRPFRDAQVGLDEKPWIVQEAKWDRDLQVDDGDE